MEFCVKKGADLDSLAADGVDLSMSRTIENEASVVAGGPCEWLGKRFPYAGGNVKCVYRSYNIIVHVASSEDVDVLSNRGSGVTVARVWGLRKDNVRVVARKVGSRVGSDLVTDI